MAKFYGEIGFVITTETSPGIWEETVTKKNYYGNIIKNSRRYESGDKVNDDITINNSISIIADNFAIENFGIMKYVVWCGKKWKITNIEVEYPRLILTIGGIYNG